MMRLLVLMSVASMGAVSTTARAQTNDCELHIWPTKQIGAVYHGSRISAYGVGYGLTLTLSPSEQVAQQLGTAIDPASQIAEFDKYGLDTTDRFQGYKIVIHEAPEQPKYQNWIDKKVGSGNRDTDSTAACYAEMHVIFITLFRTALSKKIQTGFLVRQFGKGTEAQFAVVDGGSTGAPDFVTNGDEKSDKARQSVRAAFSENLKIFLRSKKWKKPVRVS